MNSRRRRLHLGKSAILLLKKEACRGRDPESTVHAYIEVDNRGFGKALGCSKTLKLAAVIPVQAVLRSHPEESRSILRQACDIQVAKSLRVLSKAVTLGRARRG